MKKQLVNIDFNKDQGVILKWNYVDLTKTAKFFRHILVLLTNKREIAASALAGYIKQIKLGDLYCAFYCDSRRLIRMGEWREKTNRGVSSLKPYLEGEELASMGYEQVFPFIERQIQQINEPTIVNFILEKESKIQGLRDHIKKRQVASRIKFICNIFSPNPYNLVSISEGINSLSINQPFIYQFFHHYANQMAIEFAHLTITCSNGEINSCNQQDWTNTAFNKIERKYYGPSIRYQMDRLHFVSSQITSGSYDLQIQLYFKCFGGKIYTAEKKIAIHVTHRDCYNRTVSLPRKRRVYYSTEDVELEETPYETETLIYFQRIGDKSVQI